MTHQPNIWTGDVRRLLYTRLVQKFGPSWDWKKSGSPGGALEEQFDEFCATFADAVGAKSGEAVQHQIRFTMPEGEKPNNWGRHAQTAILNKAAALESGFIKDSQLPNLVAVGRIGDAEWVLLRVG